MFTPVGSIEFLNSIVWLISLTRTPRRGHSRRSIASTPPPTADAARRHTSRISGVISRREACPPPRRVGDPVLAPPHDPADRLVPDDEDPQVPLRLLHVLLHVEHAVLHRSERRLVLDHRLRRVPVVHPRQEPSPRARRRLQHRRVPVLFDRPQRRLGVERDPRARRGNPASGEQDRRRQLVPARLDHRRAVDARHAVPLEHPHRRQRVRLADAPVEHGREAPPRRAIVNVEHERPRVDQLVRDVPGRQLVGEQPLFDTDARMKQGDGHEGP